MNKNGDKTTDSDGDYEHTQKNPIKNSNEPSQFVSEWNYIDYAATYYLKLRAFYYELRFMSSYR